MPATPNCWPIWCAPTGTTTARSPATATDAEAIKVLARAHQNLIWARTRHTNAPALGAAGVLPGGAGGVRRPGRP